MHHIIRISVMVILLSACGQTSIIGKVPERYDRDGSYFYTRITSSISTYDDENVATDTAVYVPMTPYRYCGHMVEPVDGTPLSAWELIIERERSNWHDSDKATLKTYTKASSPYKCGSATDGNGWQRDIYCGHYSEGKISVTYLIRWQKRPSSTVTFGSCNSDSEIVDYVGGENDSNGKPLPPSLKTISKFSPSKTSPSYDETKPLVIRGSIPR